MRNKENGRASRGEPENGWGRGRAENTPNEEVLLAEGRRGKEK